MRAMVRSMLGLGGLAGFYASAFAQRKAAEVEKHREPYTRGKGKINASRYFANVHGKSIKSERARTAAMIGRRANVHRLMREQGPRRVNPGR